MKITKNKNKYFSYLQKQFSKFAVALVVASMLFGTLGINQTSAYFSDTASITGNTFTAGTLSIDLNNTENYSSGLMYPTDTTSTSMDISNTGSLNSQYVASTTLSSDTSACDYVTMTVTNQDYLYTGLIKNFISPATSTTASVWNYSFKIDPTAPPSVWNKTCFFKWTYTAWQDNLNDASTGFTSTKEKLGSIRIGKAVVLNEVLTDPNTTSLAPSNKEFIELYNNSNIEIDVAGWKVSEMSGSTEQKYTITTTETPVSYRAVPYGDSTTILPKSWIVLQFSTSVLNNEGDTVRFYDSSGVVKLDEFSYPMDGDAQKASGYSYARIPNGVGTWVDPIPTPGTTNDFALVVENPVVDATITTGGSTADITAEEKARLEAEAKVAAEKIQAEIDEKAAADLAAADLAAAEKTQAEAEAEAKVAAEKIQAELDAKAAADLAASEKAQAEAEADAKVAAEKAAADLAASEKAAADQAEIDAQKSE